MRRICFRSFPGEVYFGIFFGLNGLIGTILNMIVIIIFITNKYLRNKSDFHILSLTFADLLITGLLAPYMSYLFITGKHIYCKDHELRKQLFNFWVVSAVTITFIAYDRCLHIKHKVTYNVSSMKFFFMIFIPWMVPLTFQIADGSSKILRHWLFLFVYILTHFGVMFSYFKVWQVLRERYNFQFDSRTKKKVYRENMKCKKFIWLLVIVFVSLTSEALIFKAMDIYAYYWHVRWIQKNRGLLTTIVNVGFQLNSSLNPVLYFMRHRKIRTSLKRVYIRWKNVYCAKSHSRDSKHFTTMTTTTMVTIAPIATVKSQHHQQPEWTRCDVLRVT